MIPFFGILHGRENEEGSRDFGNVLNFDLGCNAGEHMSQNYIKLVRLRFMHFTACVLHLIKKCPGKMLPLLFPFNLLVVGMRKRRVVWGILCYVSGCRPKPSFG